MRQTVFLGLHLHQGIFAILTINAPKWPRSTGTCQFASYATFFSLPGAVRLNCANYEKYNKTKENYGLLPNLHESLVGIHNFPSICLKIVATNYEIHNKYFVDIDKWAFNHLLFYF